MVVIYSLLPGTQAVPCGSCPNGWQRWGDSCYVNVVKRRQHTQPNAKKLCETFGARLATPNSKQEHEFVRELFLSSFPDRNPEEGFWMDCSDKTQEGVWVCRGDDDSGAPYRPSFSTAPNTATADCAVLSTSNTLHPWDCSVTKNVMCEQEAPPSCHQSSSCFAVATRRCLLNHTLEVTTAERPAQCCVACNAIPGCRSFNHIDNRCQLNNATRFDVDRSKYFKETDNCIYYEM